MRILVIFYQKADKQKKKIAKVFKEPTMSAALSTIEKEYGEVSLISMRQMEDKDTFIGE